MTELATENTTESIALAGFTARFDAICSAIQVKKYGRVRYFSDIAGLSWSGAKACYEDDRAPKRQAALHKMGEALSHALKQQCNILVSPSEVEEFLVSDSGLLKEAMHNHLAPEADHLKKWDISSISSAFNARVIVMIHRVGNDMGIDVFSDLSKDQFELLNRKMTIYCYNHSDIESMEEDEAIQDILRSMIIVARAKLQ